MTLLVGWVDQLKPTYQRVLRYARKDSWQILVGSGRQVHPAFAMTKLRPGSRKLDVGVVQALDRSFGCLVGEEICQFLVFLEQHL